MALEFLWPILLKLHLKKRKSSDMRVRKSLNYFHYYFFNSEVILALFGDKRLLKGFSNEKLVEQKTLLRTLCLSSGKSQL